MGNTGSDSYVPASQIKKLWIVFGSIGAVLVLLLAFVFSKLMDERHRERQAMVPVAEQISQVRQIVLALRTYAADFDDAFPPNLPILLDNGYYIDLPELLETDFTVYGDREQFLYRPGYGALDYSRTAMVIAPASPLTGRRVIGYVGGSVAEVEISNEEVEKLMAKDPALALPPDGGGNQD